MMKYFWPPDFKLASRVTAILLATLALGTVDAQAQMGPDYWKVQGVASNDTLNIRSGPSTQNRVVAHAPNGAVFRNLGCRGEGSTRWCHLETPDGQLSGWASGRYLQESGPPSTGTYSGRNDVPELHVRRSGEIEVRFSTGCTALYNPIGNRIAAGSSCSRSQLSHAHDAVERQLRESGSGDSHSADVSVLGSGTIIGGARLKGNVIGHQEGHYALIISGEGIACTAALQHRPGEVGSERGSVHCTNGAHGSVKVSQQRRGSIANFDLTDGTHGWIIFE